MNEVPSKSGEEFTEIEIKRIHREMDRRGWKLANFFEAFAKAVPHLAPKDFKWEDNIDKIVSESPNRRRAAQGYHRGAFAKTFGCTPEWFEAFLRGEVISTDQHALSLDHHSLATVGDFVGREEEIAKLADPCSTTCCNS